MKQTAFSAAVSDSAPAFLLFVVLLCPVTHESLSNERRYTVSVQGKKHCPNFSSTGPRKVLTLRSNLECAKACVSSSECLHFGYQKNNGSCTLYSTTPANLYPADDCTFMLVSVLIAIYANQWCNSSKFIPGSTSNDPEALEREDLELCKYKRSEVWKVKSSEAFKFKCSGKCEDLKIPRYGLYWQTRW